MLITRTLPLNVDYLSEFQESGLVFPPVVKRSVYSRKNEFAAGRLCVMQALSSLGYSGVAVYQDGQGRPLWPDNIVGSISHTHCTAICQVGNKKTYLSLGIDIEQISYDADIIVSLAETILTKQEILYLNNYIKKWSYVELLYLLFSAKESLYKCINPISDIQFDFLDFELCHIDLQHSKAFFKIMKNIDIKISLDRFVEVDYLFANNRKIIMTNTMLLNNLKR